MLRRIVGEAEDSGGAKHCVCMREGVFMRASTESILRLGTNDPWGENASNNLEPIPFGVLVSLAFPGAKPEFALAERTNCDPSTCRRWITRRQRPPAVALAVVLGEIIRRYN